MFPWVSEAEILILRTPRFYGCLKKKSSDLEQKVRKSVLNIFVEKVNIFSFFDRNELPKSFLIFTKLGGINSKSNFESNAGNFIHIRSTQRELWENWWFLTLLFRIPATKNFQIPIFLAGICSKLKSESNAVKIFQIRPIFRELWRFWGFSQYVLTNIYRKIKK